jgi:hypothetical protein
MEQTELQSFVGLQNILANSVTNCRILQTSPSEISITPVCFCGSVRVCYSGWLQIFWFAASRKELQLEFATPNYHSYLHTSWLTDVFYTVWFYCIFANNLSSLNAYSKLDLSNKASKAYSFIAFQIVAWQTECLARFAGPYVRLTMAVVLRMSEQDSHYP